jgi:hypothetical protein
MCAGHYGSARQLCFEQRSQFGSVVSGTGFPRKTRRWRLVWQQRGISAAVDPPPELAHKPLRVTRTLRVAALRITPREGTARLLESPRGCEQCGYAVIDVIGVFVILELR